MKKYFFPILLISILPGIAFGASARFTQLVREKQQKMEQLEKCMGASKGLKIAGVSTLGLTAVGVAGNIAEAKMIDSNTKTIAKNTEKIKTAKEDLDNAKLLAECKTALTAENANADKITSVEKDEDGNCKILTCEDGYKPNNDGDDCEMKEKLQEVMTEDEAACMEKIKKLISNNKEEVYTRAIEEARKDIEGNVANKNERITFNGQTKECRVNQKYIDCLGVDFIQQLVFAKVEVELMSSQCDINKELIISVEEFD